MVRLARRGSRTDYGAGRCLHRRRPKVGTAVPSGVLLSPAGSTPVRRAHDPAPPIGRLGACPRPEGSTPPRSRAPPRPSSSCSPRWRSRPSPPSRPSSSPPARSSPPRRRRARRLGVGRDGPGNGPRDRPLGLGRRARRPRRGLRPVRPACGSPGALVEAVVVLATFTGARDPAAHASGERRAPPGRHGARSATRSSGSGGSRSAGSSSSRSSGGRCPGRPPRTRGRSQAVLAVLVGAAAISLAEELAFRGVVQHWLGRTTGEWPAVVVQGVAYGLWVAAVGWGPAIGIVAVRRRPRGGRHHGAHQLDSHGARVARRDRRPAARRHGLPVTGRGGEPARRPRSGPPRSTSTRRASERWSAGSFPTSSLDGLAPLAAGWDNALWVTGEGIAFRFPAPGDRRAGRGARDRPAAARSHRGCRCRSRYRVGRPAGRGLPVAVLRRAAAARHRDRRRAAGRPRGRSAVALAGFLRALHEPSLVASSGPGSRATRSDGPT